MTSVAATFLILCPMAAAALLLLVPASNGRLIRAVALLGAALTLPVSIWMCATYDRSLGGYQFGFKAPWIPELGVSFHVAADGISVVLVLLTSIIITAGVFASWGLQNRTKEFLALLLFLVSGVFGVFLARDLFFLFLFYEIAVLPMYLLIGVWGTSSQGRTKEYSAMKLTLMLMAGSALILVAILAIYFQGGQTFDMDDLARNGVPAQAQNLIFLAIYVGFGILAGIWPLHTWSPDGHASAPTAVSMLHAGVLMKLGAYGVLRLGLEIVPNGFAEWSYVMAIIATINILYGALCAMGQTDLKYIVAYSSVSHMGVVMLGIASGNSTGINGSVMQMVSHGLMTGLFFAVVGLVYERSHTRDVLKMGGFAKAMPGVAVCLTVGGFASFGLPATSGFIAEFLCFYGMWLAHPWLALLSVFGIVLTAFYVLRALQRIFLGESRVENYPDLRDARSTEWVAITSLAALLIVLGCWPKPVVDTIGSALPKQVSSRSVAASASGMSAHALASLSSPDEPAERIRVLRQPVGAADGRSGRTGLRADAQNERVLVK